MRRHWLITAIIALAALWACERIDLNENTQVGDDAETSSSGAPPVQSTNPVQAADGVQGADAEQDLAAGLKSLAYAGSSEHDGHDHDLRSTPPAADRAATSPPPSGPAPAITFDTASHDFGRLYQGEKKTFTYRFENTGEGDLVIKDVKPTCGCTVGDVSSKYLRPGEEATIDIEFDSTKFRGKVTKYIKVYSNDPQRQVLDLTFTADIAQLFTTDPPIINFEQVYKGENPTRSVTITATDGNDFEILEVLPNSPFLEMKVEKIRNQGNPAARVDVTVQNTSVIQNLVARPTIRIDHPRAEEIHFAVRANILANLAIEPSDQRIAFGRIPAGQTAEQVLTITNREPGLDLEISDVRLESNLDLRTKLEDGSYKKYVAAELQTVEEGQIYKIILRTSPDIPDSYFHGRLMFSTNNPDVSSKSLMYHGFIMQNGR